MKEEIFGPLLPIITVGTEGSIAPKCFAFLFLVFFLPFVDSISSTSLEKPRSLKPFPFIVRAKRNKAPSTYEQRDPLKDIILDLGLNVGYDI